MNMCIAQEEVIGSVSGSLHLLFSLPGSFHLGSYSYDLLSHLIRFILQSEVFPSQLL